MTTFLRVPSAALLGAAVRALFPEELARLY
jgi:hypothetical protein